MMTFFSKVTPRLRSGGVAQLVRAHGSYPWRHWFDPSLRYHSLFYSINHFQNLLHFILIINLKPKVKEFL